MGPPSTLFVPQQHPRSSLLDDAKLVLRLVEEHPDLDKRKCSRLVEMARAVAAGDGAIIPTTAPCFPLVVQANRDLLQFAFIWNQLRPQPGAAVWRRVRRLFGDKALPSQSTERSDARNIQCELFCEAMLARAGLEPVHQERGVDFQCQLGEREFVVEAKLARTLDAVGRELKRAAKQIDAACKPGVVVLDYTFAVNDSVTEHVFAFPTRLTGVSDAQRRRFIAFRNDHLRRLEAELTRRRVMAVVLVDHLVIHDGVDDRGTAGRWQLATFRDSITLRCSSEADRRLAGTVVKVLGDLGLPSPPED